jgi:serine/threonine protein kinase
MNDPKKQYYYAIKIQNPEYYKEGKLEVNTFLKISKIQSEYLINMIEHFKFKPLQSKQYAICMVFELMACSIYQLIRRGKYKKGLPPEIVYNISLQIIKGVKDIHDKLQMIHTDIKPENILIKGYEKNIKYLINEVDKYNLSNMYKEILDNEKNNTSLSLKKTKNIKKLKQIVRNKMKEQVISIMDQIKQNSESEKELEDEDMNNIQVVISDFGSIIDLNDYNKKAEIQTRYYRAPEIILNNLGDFNTASCSLSHDINNSGGNLTVVDCSSPEPKERMKYYVNRRIDDFNKLSEISLELIKYDYPSGAAFISENPSQITKIL